MFLLGLTFHFNLFFLSFVHERGVARLEPFVVDLGWRVLVKMGRSFIGFLSRHLSTLQVKTVRRASVPKEES